MRKKQEQIKKLRKKGNTHIKNGEYDKAIDAFLEGLQLEPNNESLLKNLSNLYYEIKDYQNAENYSSLLLQIDNKNLEANNIKFNSLLRIGKKEEANDFLEKSEVLKNQGNYIELKSLSDPEYAKANKDKIELYNYQKENSLEKYKLNIRKLFKLEEEQFYIDSKYAPEYHNPKLTLLEKQEHGTKIIANEDIKKGELLCVSKALLVHLEQSINDFEFFTKIFNEFTNDQKNQFLTLSREENLNLTLNERIENGHLETDYSKLITTYNHNCYAIGQGSLGFLKPYPYEGSGCFIYPAYFNHSCDPNTFRFTIGDIFILLAMRDINKNEEVCTIYVGANQNYDVRR